MLAPCRTVIPVNPCCFFCRQNWSKIFTEDGCKNELSPEVQLLAMDILKEYMTEIKATEAQFIKVRTNYRKISVVLWSSDLSRLARCSFVKPPPPTPPDK